MGFLGGSNGKITACTAEDWVRFLGGEDPWRSILAWWAIVPGVAKSRI